MATPITNFATSGSATSTITIEGQSVVKNTIRKIHFGIEYNVASGSTPTYFLAEFSELEDYNIPEGYTIIGANCLARTKVRQVTVPMSITAIRDSFLLANNAIESVVLPEGVTTVGSSCIQACGSLREITLPSTLRQLGTYLCRSCSALESIHIGSLDISLVSATVGGTLANNFTIVPSTGIITASTQALGEAFRAQFPALAGWTIQVTS